MTAPEPCPVCDGLPQDFWEGDVTNLHFPDRTKPCCNPVCAGRRSHGCYHCHFADFGSAPTLDIIEAWARARGWWHSWREGQRWQVYATRVVYWPEGKSPGRQVWRYSPSVALLWAVLLDGEPLTVVGDTREAARLVLDAGPNVAPDPECSRCGGHRVVGANPSWSYPAGEPEPCPSCIGFPVHEYLAVAADQAQQAGDPRGEWLALALAGAAPEKWEPAARLRLARSAHRGADAVAASFLERKQAEVAAWPEWKRRAADAAFAPKIGGDE